MSKINFLIGFLAFSIFAAPNIAVAQEKSLLDEIEDKKTTDYVTNAFKSTRVVNSQSMEMLGHGVLDFRILHRFGRVSNGAYEFFGLDNAVMRLGFDYGITPNLSVGIGRSTSKKELDGFLKYRLLWQSSGAKTMPVSVLGVSGVTYNGLKDPFGTTVDASFEQRLAYYQQIIVGRKFNDRFSAQITPTYLHRNIVQNQLYSHDLFAFGFGGRAKISNRVAVVVDYTHAFNRFPNDPTADPLTIGFDIETGGHVFQLHFSNALGMNERAFITDANGNFFKGDIQFGFNISRVFQVYEPK
jgi:Membrane bound beta barrel domain (DUF5777)